MLNIKIPISIALLFRVDYLLFFPGVIKVISLFFIYRKQISYKKYSFHFLLGR